MIVTIDRNVDLVFSQDDEDETGEGWYFQAYSTLPNEQVSQSFSSQKLAMDSLQAEKVEYS